METVPARGHFFKMDKEREIAEHVAKGLGDCEIIKSSEYDGSEIAAESIGIVFPAHSWGISLAVYSFVSSLKVKPGTYVYAVATGEKMFADSTGGFEDISSMDRFERLFVKNNLGTRADIYVRCGNIKRIPGGTEERIRYSLDICKRIKHIMKGLLCYSLHIEDRKVLSSKHVMNAAFDSDGLYESHSVVSSYSLEEIRNTSRNSSISLGNVFLDEDMLAGVRLCQVM